MGVLTVSGPTAVSRTSYSPTRTHCSGNMPFHHPFCCNVYHATERRKFNNKEALNDNQQSD